MYSIKFILNANCVTIYENYVNLLKKLLLQQKPCKQQCASGISVIQIFDPFIDKVTLELFLGKVLFK